MTTTTAPPRLDRLAGPGGLRPAPVLLHITATVELTADTTLSTGDPGSSSDTAIARDAATGRPLWPGSTQAGLLRHHLSSLTADPDGSELVRATFGSTDRQSALHSADVTAVLPEGTVPGRRHGNRVDPRTGLVEDGGVFGVEVLPAGTTFRIDWRLHLDRAASGSVPDALLGLVLAASGLDGSADGIRLGARSGRGRGTVRAAGWRVQAYDLATPAGFLAWYTRTPDTGDTGGVTDLLEALRACDGLPVPVDELAAAVDAVPDERERIVFRLDVAVGEPDDHGGVRPGTLLHGQAQPPVRGAPRLAPLRRPTADGPAGWIDPGTAVHSLLGRQARWIAHSLATRPEDAETLVASLFGERPGPGGGTPRPAAVRETDAVLEGASTRTMTRNRINPLTQGTVPGLLFSEDVVVGGTARWTVVVRRPTPAQIGLLALVLRDLADGTCVAQGHGTAVGHGRRVLTGGQIEFHGAGLRELLGAEPSCSWSEFREGPVPASAVYALHEHLGVTA